MSLTTTTYVEVVCDLVAGLAAQGFRSIVLLNGHGGNERTLRVAVDRLTNELRCGATSPTSYFQIASSDWSPGHAGHFETSLMLALTPEYSSTSNDDRTTPRRSRRSDAATFPAARSAAPAYGSRATDAPTTPGRPRRRPANACSPRSRRPSPSSSSPSTTRPSTLRADDRGRSPRTSGDVSGEIEFLRASAEAAE